MPSVVSFLSFKPNVHLNPEVAAACLVEWSSVLGDAPYLQQCGNKVVGEVQVLQPPVEECKASLLAFECLQWLQHAYLSPGAICCSYVVLKDAVF